MAIGHAETTAQVPVRRSPDSRAGQVVILGIGAIALGIIVVYNPSWALGVAAAIPLVLITARRTGTVAVTVLLWGGLKYSVIRLAPGISGLLAQVEIAAEVLVAIFTLLKLWRRTQTTRGVAAPFMLVLGFTAVALASWAANSGTLIALFAGVRSLVTMPLLALSAMVAGTDADLRYLLRGGIALTMIQVPIAYAQFAMGGLASDVDLVNGTLGFGGANLLGVWMLAATGAAFYVFLRRGGFRWLLAAVAFMSVIVMSGARLSMLSLPVLLVVLGLTALFRRGSAQATARFVGSGVVILILAIGLVASVYYEYAQAGIRVGSAASDLNPATLLQRQSQIGDYSVPRLAYLAYGWTYLQNESRFWLIGTGPATAGSGSAAAASADYESSSFATGLRLRSEGLATYASSSRVVTQTSQFVSTTVEYGPLGLALLLGLYVMVGAQTTVTLASAELGTRRALLAGALPVVFIFATFGTLYGVTWEGLNIIGLGFWWVAILSRTVPGSTNVASRESAA